MRYLLGLLTAMSLGAAYFPAHGAEAASEAITLTSQCGSPGASQSCSRCEVKLDADLTLPKGDHSITWSCPKMAAGRYEIDFSAPVRLVPPTPSSPIFSQLLTSFRGRVRRPDGAKDAVFQEGPRSWSWWGDNAATVRQTGQINVAKDAEMEFELTFSEPTYYVPRQTQGPGHRDGEMVIEKAAFSYLTREPDAAASDRGEPREFSAATLAQIVPHRSTMADVEKLLGPAWRASDGDADEAEPAVWEYRGRDAADSYRVHIEFDKSDVVTLLAKVSDATKETKADIQGASTHPLSSKARAKPRSP
jgi:hypothetical protein